MLFSRMVPLTMQTVGLSSTYSGSGSRKCLLGVWLLSNFVKRSRTPETLIIIAQLFIFGQLNNNEQLSKGKRWTKHFYHRPAQHRCINVATRGLKEATIPNLARLDPDKSCKSGENYFIPEGKGLEPYADEHL